MASPLLYVRKAAFAAAYGSVDSCKGMFRWIEPKCSTIPAPDSIMAGRSARSSRTALRRFRFSSASHCSSVTTANPPGGVDEPPTTCTRTSSGPPSATLAATVAAPTAVEVSASMNRSGRS